MASTQEYVDFVLDQLNPECDASAKKMFGEYGVYSGDVFFGLICDDRFFVKPTDAGRDYIGEPVEAPAYPGAKDSFLVGEGLGDRDWVVELVRRTVADLPPPKKKKKKPKKTS